MRLGFVIVYVDDVRQCIDFYQRAFGIPQKMIYEDGGEVLYGELETDGATLGFASHALGALNLNGQYQKTDPSALAFGQEIVFVCEDVASSYTRALDAGAMPLAEPVDKPWGQTVAYVRASEGTLIEICSPINQ